MPVWRCVSKPSCAADTVYSPTGTEGAENRPSTSVVSVRLAPVSTCRTTTVAPDSAAPLASCTVPLMLPPTTCACAARAPAKNSRTKIRYNFDASVTGTPEDFPVVNCLFFLGPDLRGLKPNGKIAREKNRGRTRSTTATTTIVPPGGRDVQLRVGKRHFHGPIY